MCSFITQPLLWVDLKLERFPEEDALASRDHDQNLDIFFPGPCFCPRLIMGFIL